MIFLVINKIVYKCTVQKYKKTHFIADSTKSKTARKLFKDEAPTAKVVVEDIKETVKLIASTTLKQDVSVILDDESKDRVYINLVPKIKIDITYGYGALSCDGEDICGDNYLIKELKMQE